MKIAAHIANTPSGHSVEVEAEGRKQSIAIAPKSTGRGSSVNGGELLFAALATCFCNDLYRGSEARHRGSGCRRRSDRYIRKSRRASTRH